MTEPIHVFIGYDDRQPEAFLACQQSILETSSGSVDIYSLGHQTLRNKGFFTRPWKITEKGEFIDSVDGKPFSTQFSHTRFLVPYVAKQQGMRGYAIFVDSDFIFLNDIHQLIEEVKKQGKKPVYCVQHEYVSESDVKMDGRNQFNYNKKLWTSLMVFDLSFEFKLDPYLVNTWTGRDLHQFKWLSHDSDIGKIPETWNFIPDHSETRVGKDEYLNAIHYTVGTPHMPGYENCSYCDFYWGAYTRALALEAKRIAESRWKIINGRAEKNS